MNTPTDATALADLTPTRHLTGDQRAALLNMIGTDLNMAAEVLMCVAGIVSGSDPDFATSQDLASDVRGPVRDLKARAVVLAG